MDIKYEVKLSSKFVSSLQNACDYIEQVLYQEQAARYLVKSINEKSATLSDFPYSYPLCEGKLGNAGYRKFLVGNFFVIYEINEKTKVITLLNCVYARSDYLNKL